jgi:hypothetical protein
MSARRLAVAAATPDKPAHWIMGCSIKLGGSQL